ncbi:MAG: DUF4926 domain-containing protein [Thermoguttaceae bacterium]|jgi:hypothetical protein|nr:DUF4926 domain-containing protein [Thermoguttaceae bacterium]
MTNTKKPELLDLVAVLRGADDPNVEVGDVGTVVELLPPDGAEIEFLDRTGKTRCLATLRVDDLLVLNRQRTPVG